MSGGLGGVGSGVEGEACTCSAKGYVRPHLGVHETHFIHCQTQIKNN